MMMTMKSRVKGKEGGMKEKENVPQKRINQDRRRLHTARMQFM